MTFWGLLKVTNVKVTNIFSMVRGKHGVIMKHLWEVDTGLSESAKNLTLGDLKEGISSCLARKMFIIAQLTKVPLALIDLYGSLQGHTHI